MKFALLFLFLANELPAQEPLKLLVYPKAPLLMPYLKKCAAITVMPGGAKDIQTAPYLLDASATGLRWHGTLYNQDGDELVAFNGGIRTAPFVQQICHYFEGLRERDR